MLPLSFDTIALIAVALGLLYLYLTWNYNYWKKRGIAYEKPALIFGNIKEAFFMRKNFGEIFMELYDKYPAEKVVGWYNFRSPNLMVKDPELVHKILVTEFNNFRNNDFELDEDVDPILGRNIFVMKDEMWKKSRALITPAFTAGKIKPIFAQMLSVANDLSGYLKEHPEELHIKHVMSRYTTEIVAKCALGIEGNCFKEPKPMMHEMGKLVFEPDFIKGIKFLLFFLLPNISKLLKLRMVPEKVTDFFNSILKDVIVYRQQNDIQRNDLVQYLIDVKRKTIEVEKGNIKSDIVTRTYTDQDILSGCIMFFIEGYETSSLILTNTLYLLAINKDAQEKLREEIDETLKKGELTFETVNEMSYLNCVFQEANRVLPAAFAMKKLCTETCTLDVGKEKPLVIEKGIPILIPLIKLHNDPQYWEDADVFKPERFANKEDLQARAKGVFLPFGDGPRMCVGMRLASMLIKVALIKILSKFEVLPTSKTPKKMEFDPNYFMVGQKGGMFLRFAERSR